MQKWVVTSTSYEKIEKQIIHIVYINIWIHSYEQVIYMNYLILG